MLEELQYESLSVCVYLCLKIKIGLTIFGSQDLEPGWLAEGGDAECAEVFHKVCPLLAMRTIDEFREQGCWIDLNLQEGGMLHCYWPRGCHVTCFNRINSGLFYIINNLPLSFL